ncbi:MAG: efflux RND transporter permease subunit [Bacteroidota bacterium]
MSKTDKEFFLSSWAIDNRTVINVLIALALILGITAYTSMPRENFPEIKETKIYVSSLFPGNTAEDIEKLITDPLEERLRNVSNVVDIESTSQEDYSMIIVEFNEDITVEEAKIKVKDEVDQETSSEDWPTFNNAKVSPNIFNLSMSEEMPILNINIQGDYPVQSLKAFAERLQDEIEKVEEIKQADIRGAQDKEVEVAVDVYKMMASQVSFNDIIGAINGGNMTMSAGNMIASGQRRAVSVIGEIDDPNELLEFVVKSERGNTIYLKDVAEVSFKEKDRTTYARDFGENVVMLDIKKRAGMNMVAANDKVRKITEDMIESEFPSDLKVTYSNDMSKLTLNQVDDLVNNIIFGVILVVGVLMFFLGFRNALFVGFAIPMSMFISFSILSALGYTLNTMILFGLIMGLGMLVDNGIVVVENVYRLMEKEGMSRIQAAKKGIGEIAFPIIISTLTTVAAFIPLGMWPGVMGEFMIYFPVTLSVVLGSSLFVAVFMNSMMVSRLMKVKEDPTSNRRLIIVSGALLLLGTLISLSGSMTALGSLMIFAAIMIWVFKYILKPGINGFQNRVLPRLENFYEGILIKALSKKRPIFLSIFTFVLLIAAFMMFGGSVASQRTKIEFFPDNKPNQINVYVEYPQGTDIEKTNAITKDIEQRVYKVLRENTYLESDGYNYMVESAVSQVGEGAGNPQTDAGNAAEMPHKGRIAATLREFKYRKGQDSEELRKKVQKEVTGVYPGLAISVEKDAIGPPAGYPINIEIEGENYEELIAVAEQMRDFINAKNVPGVAELKIDVNKGKPGMNLSIDRQKAGQLGVNTSQIGQQLRSSIFGSKAGIYKVGGDDFDINVRFKNDIRYDENAIFDQKVVFRDMADGQIKEVPVSAVTTRSNTSGFSAIKHKSTRRVVTVYSALEPGFTDAGAIVRQIESEMGDFTIPKGIKFNFTGQIEEQNKQMEFLMGAFFAGLGLIFLILIFQFNALSKPTIIMMAIFLSLIGVFGGLVISGAPFVIMMTMMGIIALAGVVVNNGVVLLDYTQLLIDRKKESLGVKNEDYLSQDDLLEAIIKGGKARLRPVLLTAITTILGLIPLAYGININFFTLFAELDPKIYIGGDNVIFWGPLAKTVIYGLFVATFLTLIVVPVFFYLSMRLKMWIRKLSKGSSSSNEVIHSEKEDGLLA